VRLSQNLVVALHELMGALEKTPSESAREQEDVLAIQNNLMHLCNMLRPVQARATLRHILAQSAMQKRDLIQRLRLDGAVAGQAVRKSALACAGRTQSSGL
jgi:MED7 protein